MKYKNVLLGMVLGGLVVGCGSSSPKAFYKKSAKITCRGGKKCDTDGWKQSGYDSVSECIDDSIKEDEMEAFVDACEDFDNSKASECLSAMRKYKRSCDEDDLTDEGFEACLNVCGEITIPTGELILDPGNPEVTIQILERAVQIMEDEYEDAPALSAP